MLVGCEPTGKAVSMPEQDQRISTRIIPSTTHLDRRRARAQENKIRATEHDLDRLIRILEEHVPTARHKLRHLRMNLGRSSRV